MMEARARQQAKYDQAAKDLEEKMKNEPPPKVGPISKQIADKAKVQAKLRPGNFIEKVYVSRLKSLISVQQILSFLRTFSHWSGPNYIFLDCPK